MGANNAKQERGAKILQELPDMYTEIGPNSDTYSHPELPALRKYTVLLNKHEKGEY